MRATHLRILLPLLLVQVQMWSTNSWTKLGRPLDFSSARSHSFILLKSHDDSLNGRHEWPLGRMNSSNEHKSKQVGRLVCARERPAALEESAHSMGSVSGPDRAPAHWRPLERAGRERRPVRKSHPRLTIEKPRETNGLREPNGLPVAAR